MNTKHLENLLAEATQDGILLTQTNCKGTPRQSRVIGYNAAVRALDRGDYDRVSQSGIHLAAAILEGEDAGFYRPDNEYRAVFWRWLVAGIFIRTMAEENGIAEVKNKDGGVDYPAIYVGKHGGMSIYPFAERFSLASHIEAIGIEKYGLNDGYAMAVRMYQDMVKEDFTLSDFGRNAFVTLHDSFIKDINENGIPPQPVTH